MMLTVRNERLLTDARNASHTRGSLARINKKGAADKWKKKEKKVYGFLESEKSKIPTGLHKQEQNEMRFKKRLDLPSPPFVQLSVWNILGPFWV